MSKTVENIPYFKQLFADMLGNNGKFYKLDLNLRLPFTCYVYTSVPKFFVSDGIHFITTYFTKDCIAQFQKKYPKIKMTDLHGKFINVTSWSLNLISVNSENNPLSYLNMEIQLIIEELKPNFTSKMTCNSFLLNIYKDNDVKLDFAIYQHFRLQEAASANYADPLADIEDLEEATRPSIRHDKWIVDQEPLCSAKFDLFDYDELVKKEIPELSKIHKEEVIEYMKNEYSSTYVGSKAKTSTKEKMKEELPLKLNTPDNIKLAVERIIMYQKRPEESKLLQPTPIKQVMPPPCFPKKPGTKSLAGSKRPMTISKFQEYIGWYERDKNSGKFSNASHKSSMKKPTPAIGKKQ